MPTINLGSTAASLGSSLGTGLGSGISRGLEALAEQKMKNMNQNNLLNMFQKNNYDPETSEFLAWAAQNNPKALPKILEMLGGGGTQTMQGQQGQEDAMMESGTRTMQEPQGGIRGAIAQGQQAKQGAGNTIVKAKHYDELRKQRHNLVDIMKISKRIQDRLEDPDLNTGLYSNIIGNIAPSWLNQVTEGLDKDASKLIELSAQAVKGPASKYRIATIEKGKMGVKHSKEINAELAKEALETAKLHLAELDATYPELKEMIQKSLTPSVAKIIIENEAPDPKKYPEETVWESDAGYQFVVSNGKWKPVQERVKAQ